jgi:hypothetical protein
LPPAIKKPMTTEAMTMTEPINAIIRVFCDAGE